MGAGFEIRSDVPEGQIPLWCLEQDLQDLLDLEAKGVRLGEGDKRRIIELETKIAARKRIES